MATLSVEVDISATSAEILGVIADLSSYPDWSSIHKRTSVQQAWPDGRPKRATLAMTVIAVRSDQPLFDAATLDKARRKLRRLGVNVERELELHPENTLTWAARS